MAPRKARSTRARKRLQVGATYRLEGPAKHLAPLRFKVEAAAGPKHYLIRVLWRRGQNA